MSKRRSVSCGAGMVLSCKAIRDEMQSIKAFKADGALSLSFGYTSKLLSGMLLRKSVVWVDEWYKQVVQAKENENYCSALQNQCRRCLYHMRMACSCVAFMQIKVIVVLYKSGPFIDVAILWIVTYILLLGNSQVLYKPCNVLAILTYPNTSR